MIHVARVISKQYWIDLKEFCIFKEILAVFQPICCQKIIILFNFLSGENHDVILIHGKFHGCFILLATVRASKSKIIILIPVQTSLACENFRHYSFNYFPCYFSDFHAKTQRFRKNVSFHTSAIFSSQKVLLKTRQE